MTNIILIIHFLINFIFVSNIFAQTAKYDTLHRTEEYLIYFNLNDTSMNFYDKKTKFSHKEKKRLWSVGWMGTYTSKPYLPSIEYKDDSIVIFSFTDYYENTFNYVSKYFYLYDGNKFTYVPLSDHKFDKYDYLVSFIQKESFNEKIIIKRSDKYLKVKIKIEVYSKDFNSKQKIIKKYILDTNWNGKVYFRRRFLKFISPFWIE